MTSTGTYQGLEGEARKSSKVLKPPGGGSSDIFGSAPEETSPRRVKNHNQSQLGSALFGEGANSNGTDSPRGANKPGNDSYKRLFGPPDAPPTTPNAKNHMRSNISLSGESSSSSQSSGAATSPAKSTTSSNSAAASALVNGFAASNGNNLTNDITDGNPVTGTGYAEQHNGPAMQNGTSSSGSSVGEKSSDSSPASKAPSRTRVPPGGYSSGLW